MPKHNTDGLVNWLRRARTERQLHVALQSKFRAVLGCLPASRGEVVSPDNSILTRNTLQLEFNSLIKLSCTMTHPATETKSIGLPASARGVMVFAEPLIYYFLTFNFSPSTGTKQKLRHLTVKINF
jgi:hypothetical protein